jgi:hypothetical protein
MITIDVGYHMEIVCAIIRARTLSVLFLMFGLGIFIPILMAVTAIFLLFVFPPYLVFTLWINDERKWACGFAGALLTAILAETFIPASGAAAYLLSWLPLLVVVFSSILLRKRLRELGYDVDSAEFPSWI